MKPKQHIMCVFSSNQLTEAWLVKELLNHHGIPAQVTGQYLSGGLGELPLDQPVRVLVPWEKETRAKSVLEEYWYETSQPF